MAGPRPSSMAIRTNDLALRCLGQNLGLVLEGGSPGAEREALFTGISMVEVHLVAREPAAAIGAWNFAELSQECRGRRLTHGDPFDFPLAICFVVRDVLDPLTRPKAHAPL